MNSIIQNYLSVMRNYARFAGRSSRYEYWMFVFAFAALMLVALIFEALLGIGSEGVRPLAGLVLIGHLVPNVAVTVRRLHDTDRSGWWLLLYLTGIGAIVPFIFTLLECEPHANAYGGAAPWVDERSGSKQAAVGQSHASGLVADAIIARANFKLRWWHAVIGIGALVLIATLLSGGSPDLRVSVTGRAGFQALHVQNIGTKPVTIKSITINERKECQPRSIINLDNPAAVFAPERLDIGNSTFWATGCHVVRVEIATDQSRGTYRFK